jgi:hypothetical protein
MISVVSEVSKTGIWVSQKLGFVSYKTIQIYSFGFTKWKKDDSVKKEYDIDRGVLHNELELAVHVGVCKIWYRITV